MNETIHVMVVLAALAGACSRRDDPVTLTSAKLDGTTPHDSDTRDTARRWDAAMSHRDLSLLSHVYGRKVIFHGVPLRHDQVILALGDMFVKDPSFTQSISDVRIPVDERVELKRTSVVTGKSRSDAVWLELARDGGALVVVRQGDESSDARLAAPGEEDRCEALAERAVLSTDKARALTGELTNEVRLVMGPPSWPAYVVAVIDRTTPKTVAIGWFDVVPETGEVSDTFGAETLNPDAGLLAQLRSCPD